MELTGGIFQEEVHDVLAMTSMEWFWRSAGSNVTECWEQPQKQSLFDDAWR
jgi:hypothetical protein